MEAMATEKLNRSYTRLSLRSELLDLPFGTQLLVGDIASFTGEDKGGKKLSCKRTTKGFCKRLGKSRATIFRAKKTARESGLITGDKKQGFESTFKIDDGQFLRLPNWVCQDEFAVRKNEKRKLLNSEQQVYAYLYTECTKKRNGKHKCEVSISEIAEILNLSERTVGRAIWTLIRAGLIYRAEGDKGVNAYKKSRYTLNYKLVLIKEKTENEIRKEAEKEMRRADDEPFPEFTAPNDVGKEEFTLHNKPYREKKKANKPKSKRKTISIPEASKYKDRNDPYGLGFDISSAPDEELNMLYRLYMPQYEYLSINSQTFIFYVENEIEQRELSALRS